MILAFLVGILTCLVTLESLLLWKFYTSNNAFLNDFRTKYSTIENLHRQMQDLNTKFEALKMKVRQ